MGSMSGYGIGFKERCECRKYWEKYYSNMGLGYNKKATMVQRAMDKHKPIPRK